MSDKVIPVPIAHHFKGTLQFTFTPRNGDEVTSDIITINGDDPELLKHAATLMVDMISNNHPAIKAWRKTLSKYVEDHCGA